MFDAESVNPGKQSDITPGCPGIRPLVQRFDSASGYRQSRPGKDDGQTADRGSRSRSLAARWTATDILPTKPKWMTTTATLDKTKQSSHLADFDRQRQVRRAEG